MSKIIADGEDLMITIEEVDGKITVLFNGEEDDGLRKTLDEIAAKSPPMGGTFYPEPGTMLSYYNALKNGYFFDWLTRIDVKGDIGEIPCEDDLIY